MALNREEKDYLHQIAAAIVQANKVFLEEQHKRDESFLAEYTRREQLFEKKCLERDLFISNQVAKLQKQLLQMESHIDLKQLEYYHSLGRDSFFGGIAYRWERLRLRFTRKDTHASRMKKLYVKEAHV